MAALADVLPPFCSWKRAPADRWPPSPPRAAACTSTASPPPALCGASTPLTSGAWSWARWGGPGLQVLAARRGSRPRCLWASLPARADVPMQHGRPAEWPLFPAPGGSSSCARLGWLHAAGLQAPHAQAWTFQLPSKVLATLPAPLQVLANKVRAKVAEARAANRPLSAADGFNSSTVRLLNRFLESKTQPPAAGGPHVFPPGLQKA